MTPSTPVLPLDRARSGHALSAIPTSAATGTAPGAALDKASGWLDAVDELSVPGLHFHDLRHAGNTLADRGGASLRDLMGWMGHDNVRAAITYQHASSEEDRAIAES